MSEWKAKRFWKAVTIERQDGGFAILLDGRPVRSPAKRQLIVPTAAMAEAIAAEWFAVDKVIDPRRMPVTRAANSTLDKVAPQFGEVAGMIAAYGASDLLCYRAEGPEELIARQADAWDPLLDWAGSTFDAPLVTTRGVIPVVQPEASLGRLSTVVFALSPFQMTALHDLVALTGSLVLGLAATSPAHDAETMWRLSRIDEDWQIALWGEDSEAAEVAELKHQDFLRARHFWSLASPEMQ